MRGIARSSVIVNNVPVYAARFSRLFHVDLTPQLRTFIPIHKTASPCYCSDHRTPLVIIIVLYEGAVIFPFIRQVPQVVMKIM